MEFRFTEEIVRSTPRNIIPIPHVSKRLFKWASSIEKDGMIIGDRRLSTVHYAIGWGSISSENKMFPSSKKGMGYWRLCSDRRPFQLYFCALEYIYNSKKNELQTGLSILNELIPRNYYFLNLWIASIFIKQKKYNDAYSILSKSLTIELDSQYVTILRNLLSQSPIPVNFLEDLIKQLLIIQWEGIKDEPLEDGNILYNFRTYKETSSLIMDELLKVLPKTFGLTSQPSKFDIFIYCGCNLSVNPTYKQLATNLVAFSLSKIPLTENLYLRLYKELKSINMSHIRLNKPNADQYDELFNKYELPTPYLEPFLADLHLKGNHSMDDEIYKIYGFDEAQGRNGANLALYFKFVSKPDKRCINLVSIGANANGTVLEQFFYAICLEHGFAGLEKNVQAAIGMHFYLANSKKCNESRFYLAQLFDFGVTLKQDYSRAMKLYKDANSPYSKIRLGNSFTSERQYFDFLNQSSDLSSVLIKKVRSKKATPYEIYIFCICVYEGRFMTVKNYEVAYKYATSIDYSNFQALKSLVGQMLFEGKCQEFDQTRAREMINDSAKNSKPDEPFYYDIMFRAGILAKRDHQDDLALQYFTKSGHEPSKLEIEFQPLLSEKDCIQTYKNYTKVDLKKKPSDFIVLRQYVSFMNSNIAKITAPDLKGFSPSIIVREYNQNPTDSNLKYVEECAKSTNDPMCKAVFAHWRLTHNPSSRHIIPAVQWLIEARAHKITIGDEELCQLFFKGKEVPQDIGMAFRFGTTQFISEHYDKNACNQKNKSKANFFMGLKYEFGLGHSSVDLKKALKYYEQSEKVEALRGIAWITQTTNPSKASDAWRAVLSHKKSNKKIDPVFLEAWESANKNKGNSTHQLPTLLGDDAILAEAGDPDAMGRVGLWCFSVLHDLPCDPLLRHHYIIESEKAGSKIGKILIHLINPTPKSMEELRPEIEANNGYAFYVAGHLYEFGACGRRQYSIAASYYKLAIDQGIDDAQFRYLTCCTKAADVSRYFIDPDEDWLVHNIANMFSFNNANNRLEPLNKDTPGCRALQALWSGDLNKAYQELIQVTDISNDIHAASCWGEILVKGYCSNLPKILGIAVLFSSSGKFSNIDDAYLLCKALIGKYSTPEDPKLDELLPDMLITVKTFGNEKYWLSYFKYKYQHDYSEYSDAMKFKKHEMKKVKITKPLPAPQQLLDRVHSKCEISLPEPNNSIVNQQLWGNIDAIYQNGYHKIRGKFLQMNNLFANYFINIVSSIKYVPGLIERANVLKYGVGVPMDLKQSFELYSQAASQNDQVALYKLAICYLYGEGTPQDSNKAFEILKKCTYRESKFLLYFCLVNGIGCEVNEKKGMEYFQESLEEGSLLSNSIQAQTSGSEETLKYIASQGIKWAICCSEPSTIEHYKQLMKSIRSTYPVSVLEEPAIRNNDTFDLKLLVANGICEGACEYFLQNPKGQSEAFLNRCLVPRARRGDVSAMAKIAMNVNASNSKLSFDMLNVLDYFLQGNEDVKNLMVNFIVQIFPIDSKIFNQCFHMIQHDRNLTELVINRIFQNNYKQTGSLMFWAYCKMGKSYSLHAVYRVAVTLKIGVNYWNNYENLIFDKEFINKTLSLEFGTYNSADKFVLEGIQSKQSKQDQNLELWYNIKQAKVIIPDLDISHAESLISEYHRDKRLEELHLRCEQIRAEAAEREAREAERSAKFWNGIKNIPKKMIESHINYLDNAAKDAADHYNRTTYYNTDDQRVANNRQAYYADLTEVKLAANRAEYARSFWKDWLK